MSEHERPGAKTDPLGDTSPSADESPATSLANIDVWRIIDANANRACEGLRVAEEYARFCLDDAHLVQQFKSIRHELAAALGMLPESRLFAAREVSQDVGTQVKVPSELRRGSIDDVLGANLKRVQQGLRCLEEYGKLLDVQLAAAVEPLRYRVYNVEQALMITRFSCQQLAAAQLYVIIDGGADEPDFHRRAQCLMHGGIDVVQLRDKTLGDRELLGRAHLLAQLAREVAIPFIMNDRPDLALLAGADGVHCGQEELSVRDVRRIIGPDKLVGISTHSLQQARQAVLQGASYIGCGPTFPTPTKAFDCYPGLELLREIHHEIRLPAFAIGGITPDNLAEVVTTGMVRVAVSHCVWASDDPGKAVQRIRAVLSQCPARANCQ